VTISLARWIQATWLGWLLGLPGIVALALLGELLGLGGTQVAVGLGMGSGVGLSQARALRPLLGRSDRWTGVTAAGLALPFLLHDLGGALGWPVPYSLPRAVLLGGTLVAAGQAWLLRRHLPGAGWWILASLAGWALAAAATALSDSLQAGHALRGLPGALLYLAAAGAGGLWLALPTGVALVVLQRRAAIR